MADNIFRDLRPDKLESYKNGFSQELRYTWSHRWDDNKHVADSRSMYQPLSYVLLLPHMPGVLCQRSSAICGNEWWQRLLAILAVRAQISAILKVSNANSELCQDESVRMKHCKSHAQDCNLKCKQYGIIKLNGLNQDNIRLYDLTKPLDRNNTALDLLQSYTNNISHRFVMRGSFRGPNLISTNRPISIWCLPMSWHPTGTRPAATAMLTRLWTQSHIIELYNTHVMPRKWNFIAITCYVYGCFGPLIIPFLRLFWAIDDIMFTAVLGHRWCFVYGCFVPSMTLCLRLFGAIDIIKSTSIVSTHIFVNSVDLTCIDADPSTAPVPAAEILPFAWSVCESVCGYYRQGTSLITRFMRPTWGPSGSDRTQVGPMLAAWTLLSGVVIHAAITKWKPWC